MGTVQRFKQLRRQQHRTTLHITFRWQRQGEVRFLERLEHIQAHMTVAQLMAGQGRRQQHQGVALRIALMQERDEGLIQSAQPAALDPAFK